MRTLGGRYQLRQRIGVGGMSEVWRGHDEVLDRPVAVKLIAPGDRDDGTGVDPVERVRAEARSAARLAHPNVTGVHDFGLSTPYPGARAPYIVMELVEGETLADRLAGGPLPWRFAVRVCAQVSAALAAAHLHGIVHQDVKPSNVMLTPTGVKVLDFGIAASAGESDPRLDGMLLGTPAFLPPERFGGAPPAPSSDMYAIGVLLYLCLAGRLPWPVDPEVWRLEQYREPEPLPHIDGLPPEVADLCFECLAADPAARPSSFVAALLLGDVVDARVYVPTVEPTALPGRVSPWNSRAAAEPTGAVAVPGHVGRHRA
ncbi:serine/threonine-protein kinase [Polymorphospora sp. NPDC050346]|uniref:serine/threonine-protein kinase n=1 Tax=Polymorphospora sp. NPDC050346 TaxID=3155780 RepID=UPI0033EB4765